LCFKRFNVEMLFGNPLKELVELFRLLHFFLLFVLRCKALTL
jgi:hypothetical protein